MDPPKPDLVVYLQAPVECCSSASPSAASATKQCIDAPYLERLNEAYARFFHEYDAAPLLIVNAAAIDPIAQPARLRRAAGGDPAHEAAAACTTTRCGSRAI